MINWISVIDTLPEPFTDIICWHSKIGHFTGYLVHLVNDVRNKPHWSDLDNERVYSMETVTHWAYIDAPGE